MKLSGADIVGISNALADSGVNLDAVGLAAGVPGRHLPGPGMSGDRALALVRSLESGRSPVGDGGEAVLHLLAKAWDDAPGNREIAHAVQRLAQASPTPASTTRGVFLSYSTTDRAEVNLLHDALVAAGLTVFQDHRMPLGVEWFPFLREHAGNGSTMLCWLTEAYLGSVWGAYEVGLAERGSGRIVPITPRPLATGVPEFLSAKQGVMPPFDPVADTAGLVARLRPL